MPILSKFKSTVLLLFLVFSACKGQQKDADATSAVTTNAPAPIIVAANRTEAYLPLLQGKKWVLWPTRLRLSSTKVDVLIWWTPCSPL